jgi:antitoxin (DNA-binding transcriptional repressor) of toxin-antitoxin stability system
MKVSAQYAQEHFADILTAIDTGEEVELTRPGQPSVRLVLVESTSAKEQPAPGKRILGAGVGELRVPTFEEWQAMDAELVPTPTKRPRAELLYAWEGKIALPSAEEWRAMDKELEDEMLNGPIFPPEHA